MRDGSVVTSVGFFLLLATAGCGSEKTALERAGRLHRAFGHLELVSHTAPISEDHASSARSTVRSPVPDSKIRLDVRLALQREQIDLKGVGLQVDHGRVHLDGTVASPARRDRIELVVRSVESVDRVTNHIEVE